MTITFNLGDMFHEPSNDALVDELRNRTSEESILEFEKKFNSRNEKHLHVHICRCLKHRQISRSLAAKWLVVMFTNKESQIQSLIEKI